MALPEDIKQEEEENDFFDYAGDILAAPFRGIEGAVQGAYNLADYLAFDVLPDYDTRFLGTSKTMAGGAIEGISQFATGFVPLFGLAGRAGALAKAGTVTRGVVAGAATDFTFFNGQEARLSNLIQQVPELQNPVTEFLAHDEDEGELEGRMKNVLEGLGLEAVAGTFIAGLKAIKRGRKVKEEGGTAEQQAQVVNDTLEGGKAFADMPEFGKRKKFIQEPLTAQDVLRNKTLFMWGEGYSIDEISRTLKIGDKETTDFLLDAGQNPEDFIRGRDDSSFQPKVSQEALEAVGMNTALRMWDEGYSTKEISKTVNLPQDFIEKEFIGLGEDPRDFIKGRKDTGFILGEPKAAAERAERIALSSAIEMWNDGYSLREIANTLNFPEERLVDEFIGLGEDPRDFLGRKDRPFSELPAFKERGTSPDLKQRVEELGETLEDFDATVERVPRPFKTYEEEGMMDIIPKGADTLKSRLMKKFPVKGADPQDVADVEKFIDVMGKRLFGDVALSITNKIPSAGRYNFGNNLLQIRQSVIDEGGIKRTMIHELWHGLSRYLPKADVGALTKQFDKARRDYIKSFGVSLDEGADPSTLLTRTIPKELERFLKGKHTSENYRFKDVDEYFAEEMTDAFLKKLDEKDLAPTGTLKRIAQEVAIMLKDMFASLKAKLGIDQRQKIFNDFLKQRNVTKRAEAPLDMRGRLFADLPEFKKGKEDEFLKAIPEKFRGYADELLKGGTPRLPQFALETGEDVVVLKELLEKYYKENPDKVTVEGAITDVEAELEQQIMLQQGKDAAAKIAEARVVQQSIREQSKAVIDNLKDTVAEYEDAGGGSAAVAKLKNNFQQLLNVADVYRQIGRETGITLQARREDFKSRKIGLSESDIQIEGLRNAFIDASGGMHPDKLVKLIKETMDEADPESMINSMFKIAKKAQGKHFLDMPTEYWMNAILSGPRTQIVNIMGNGLTQVMSTLESVVGSLVTGNTSVVKAVLASWSNGQMWGEAAKFAKKAFKQNDNLLDPQARSFSDRPQGAITGERFAEGKLKGMVTERGLTSKKSLDAFGNFIRIPSRLLLTSDEFFKQLAYRRAARLKAAMSGIQQGIKDPKKLAEHIHNTLEGVITEGGRIGSQEGLAREAGEVATKRNLKGSEKDNFILKYVEENFDKNKSTLMQFAQDEAQYLTFTRELQDGTLGKVLQDATNKLPMLRLVLPFVRTPTNILKFAFERTPGIFALKEERGRLLDDLKSKDPIRQSRAAGKMMTGVVVGGVFLDTIFNNREYITGGGPSDPKKKEALMATGWRPYSIKIGDTYYSYQRLDPIATLLGVGADLVEVGVNDPKGFDQSGAERLFLALTLSITRNATNKSYLAGIQNFTDVLSDPDRYMAKFGQNFASSFVPNIISQMADYDTQALREVRSISDAFARKLGARSGLDKKRNLLGEEYTKEQWMGTGFINPIAMSPFKDDEVLREMAELNHAFRQPQPNLGGQIDMLEHQNETGQTAYDRQLELLQSVKVDGRTLRATLKRLVKSKDYQRFSPVSEPGLPSPRVQQINSVLTKFRREAQKQTLKEFPKLAEEFKMLKTARAGLKGGMQREDVLALLAQ